MSMHTAVHQLFQTELAEQYPNVILSNADINRIVTASVQDFNLDAPMHEQLVEHTQKYINTYKSRQKAGGCGCNKK